MLRISKLTDYATVVMAYLANNSKQPHNAKTIAHDTHIALPTVSKLLKVLTRHNLLIAQRGAKGGYSLATTANKISVVQIIQALEGDFALTECSHTKGSCSIETTGCAIRSNWRTVSEIIRSTLSNITLAEMIQPIKPKKISQHFIPLSELRHS